MTKKITLVGSVALIVGALAVQASARESREGRKTQTRAQQKQPNMQHLYLFEKDPATWEIVEDGAWGKMNHKRSGPMFSFVFNGHALEPDLDYTLIYYPDPWPGSGLICLGEDTTDVYGNVHIVSAVETGDLPAEYDDNFEFGAKIWLVLSADLNCELQQMEGWSPTEYLFENNLIFFDAAVRPGGPHPDGPHPNGPPDRTRVVVGLYEQLEGDPEDARGSGELYGCAKIDSDCSSFLSVETRLKYVEPDTCFDLTVRVGDNAASARANSISVGEICTNCVGEGDGEFEIDVSTYAGPEVYVQVVVQPVEISSTLGYATDTVPVLLCAEGEGDPE
ncbi:MAG: hypothetical protein JSU63_06060 [Phycisphaerales bacterium]|nr:MAG: hypothetical protein JSU63_06060 [Phycisphaerales bacterium]